ncbi:MAG: hypothetical protein JWM88_515 [Verrucomicrobia bacterium]|nr:hypothetical protein [Verrucomicrobiota bacterium]
MSALPRRPPPKPWSMKWIVAAIVAFVAVYTVVNVYYRKAGRAYRPYQDAQDRATTARLLSAGWQKVAINTRRPIEKPATSEAPAAIGRDFPGLGDLDAKFAEKPKLVATIDQVVAPGAVARGSDYAAYFTASLPDLKAQVGELTLFRKGNELVLIPSLETLPGKELKSRWNDSTYWLDFSTANLPPGRYEMRIVAKGPAAQWAFTVK